MTTGAAQTLLRAYQTAPGQRVLVAGNGPLNLQVARELQSSGVRVVAVAELAASPGPAALPTVLRMAFASPGLVLAGIGHTLRLVRARVPILYRHQVIGARGADRLESVTLAAVDAAGRPLAGSERDLDVDAICLGYGFLGQSEIARALGAGHVSVDGSAASLLEKDETGRSLTASEVFIAGDARGLGGARVAETQGALAGAEAARDLGFAGSARQSRQHRRDRHALRRHWRFQKALWSLYSAPPLDLGALDPTTLVCRCENVSLARLRETLEEGVDSLGSLKRATRAGMGRCQGRYCTGIVAQVAREAGHSAEGDDLYFAPRPPFKPLTIADLAAPFDGSRVFDRSAGAKTGDTAQCSLAHAPDVAASP